LSFPRLLRHISGSSSTKKNTTTWKQYRGRKSSSINIGRGALGFNLPFLLKGAAGVVNHTEEVALFALPGLLDPFRAGLLNRHSVLLVGCIRGGKACVGWLARTLCFEEVKILCFEQAAGVLPATDDGFGADR
jgi:hypothetical protein